MTKRKQISLTVKQNWEKISSKIIDDYVSVNKTKNSFKNNALVTLYIIYDILFKMNKDKALKQQYNGLNYHLLKKWSSLGNEFCSFFKYLLNRGVIERLESEKINPKTNRPYTIYSAQDGVNSQYRINPEILKAIIDDATISFTLYVSQKNEFFFPKKDSMEKKLEKWRTKDDYKDYREPNQYQQLVMQRMKRLNGRINPTFVHGRIYSNDWTNLSKQDRQMVRFDGEQVEEVFDISNCFIQLLAIKLEESKEIKQDQLNKFKDIAFMGQFYQKIVEGTEVTRDQIKQKVMHFIFSNNWTKKHGIENQKRFTGDGAVKRFDQDYVYQWNLVKNYFKNSFPSIFSYITSYEEILINGRKKSKLSVDLQWMENKYMLNGLMKELQEKGIIKEPISLHDAIFVTKKTVNGDLKAFIEKYWFDIVKHINTPRIAIKNEKNTIRQWLVETNTSNEQLEWFDNDPAMYDLFKIAYEYGTGQIKSTRDMEAC